MQLLPQPLMQPNSLLAILQLASSPVKPGDLSLSEQLVSAQPLTPSATHPSTLQLRNQTGQSTEVSPDTHAVTMGAMTVLVPLGILISIVVHRRLKTAALRRQIAALEKLWRLNCHEEIQ